ncbi:citramalate synthase [Clostridium sp. C8]|uniref:citramalate synthase n=1 Tax=Clostridium sp. C8 TaxID=1667357 RepID=UPI00062E7285|nr:citramalate synthase [Clostridium sp. C8]KLE17307.1 transferase [Clostridium sp. C8]
MSNSRIEIFDSTLRDGAQGEDISFSLEDKIKVAIALDEIGVSYIEAGNPGSNPKDMEFFKRMKNVNLKNSKLAAFGATRKANIRVEDDNNIRSLLEAETDVVVIFGKTWDFQVKDILKTSLEENIRMIVDSIKYLKSKNKEVIFDAEHFFDGYKENKKYSLETITSAKEAGADVIVLCDTNGGTLSSEIKNISKSVVDSLGGRIGIHCHNDIGMAVSNSIIAVEEGICHIQGTFIGIGERCGNANLSVIIPTLQLKMGYEAIPKEKLADLTKTARFVSEISNINLLDNMPYIGASAFAHKGGMHIDAVEKASKSYEHIKPELIGNNRRFLVSEVSGKSTILKEIQKIFPSITRDSKEVEKITNRLKDLEYEGYKFEGAEGTVELLIRKTIGKYKPFFKLNHFKTIGEQPWNNKNFTSTALINITVDGKNKMTASEGDGPVNALDKALREALESFYPQLKEVRLVDYKVRVLDSESATGAKVRVLIESTDGVENWSTVGVSRDVVEASWIALVDSLEYKLIKDIEKTVRMYF